MNFGQAFNNLTGKQNKSKRNKKKKEKKNATINEMF